MKKAPFKYDPNDPIEYFIQNSDLIHELQKLGCATPRLLLKAKLGTLISSEVVLSNWNDLTELLVYLQKYAGHE